MCTGEIFALFPWAFEVFCFLKIAIPGTDIDIDAARCVWAGHVVQNVSETATSRKRRWWRICRERAGARAVCSGSGAGHFFELLGMFPGQDSRSPRETHFWNIRGKFHFSWVSRFFQPVSWFWISNKFLVSNFFGKLLKDSVSESLRSFRNRGFWKLHTWGVKSGNFK